MNSSEVVEDESDISIRLKSFSGSFYLSACITLSQLWECTALILKKGLSLLSYPYFHMDWLGCESFGFFNDHSYTISTGCELWNLLNSIRCLRFEYGEMPQQQLAELARVTRQTIAALEASRYNPSLLLAMRIAKAFGVPVEDVFQYEENQRNSLSAGSSGPCVHPGIV